MNSKENKNITHPSVFVIFGGTGNLTKRKLIPALFDLFKKETLARGFCIVAIGRKPYDKGEYINSLEKSFGKGKLEIHKDEKWEEFTKILDYFIFDFTSENRDYSSLEKFILEKEKDFSVKGNRIFYLAVAPEYVTRIIEDLGDKKMVGVKGSWQKIMVEKPFGRSLETAQKLNEKITQTMDEDDIFRIDHYLGKDMIENLTSIRFGNAIFEPLWSNEYIDHVQINSFESIGIEGRGGYYDKSGILRDMVQSHILQVVSLICMEPPKDLDAKNITDAKVEALRALRLYNKKTIVENVVVGQYGSGESAVEKMKGYRQEEKVSKNSVTPTFTAIKMHVDNERWKGVPFYIRAGKRLSEDKLEIAVVFKKDNIKKNYDKFKGLSPDALVIRIQPVEGISVKLNIKRPGSDSDMQSVTLDCSKECLCRQNTPDAYVRLIEEALKNNHALFARWDELALSWKFVENIQDNIKIQEDDFPNYPAGSSGPERAEDLIARDKRQWI